MKKRENNYTVFLDARLEGVRKRLVYGFSRHNLSSNNPEDLITKWGWQKKEEQMVIQWVHNYMNEDGKNYVNLFIDYLSTQTLYNSKGKEEERYDRSFTSFLHLNAIHIVYRFPNLMDSKGSTALSYLIEKDFKCCNIKSFAVRMFLEAGAVLSEALRFNTTQQKFSEFIQSQVKKDFPMLCIIAMSANVPDKYLSRSKESLNCTLGGEQLSFKRDIELLYEHITGKKGEAGNLKNWVYNLKSHNEQDILELVKDANSYVHYHSEKDSFERVLSGL